MDFYHRGRDATCSSSNAAFEITIYNEKMNLLGVALQILMVYMEAPTLLIFRVKMFFFHGPFKQLYVCLKNLKHEITCHENDLLLIFWK